MRQEKSLKMEPTNADHQVPLRILSLSAYRPPWHPAQGGLISTTQVMQGCEINIHSPVHSPTVYATRELSTRGADEGSRRGWRLTTHGRGHLSPPARSCRGHFYPPRFLFINLGTATRPNWV